MNTKMFEGLKKATPEKRYKSFLTTVADREKIYFLSSKRGCAFFEIDGLEGMPLWPYKEFCQEFETEEDKLDYMDVHDFLEQCIEMEENVTFFVFPTEKNTYVVDKEELCQDIQEYLDQVE